MANCSRWSCSTRSSSGTLRASSLRSGSSALPGRRTSQCYWRRCTSSEPRPRRHRRPRARSRGATATEVPRTWAGRSPRGGLTSRETTLHSSPRCTRGEGRRRCAALVCPPGRAVPFLSAGHEAPIAVWFHLVLRQPAGQATYLGVVQRALLDDLLAFAEHFGVTLYDWQREAFGAACERCARGRGSPTGASCSFGGSAAVARAGSTGLIRVSGRATAGG